MAKINVNGLALQVESSGDGEPVVLVHGSWGDLHSWDALVLPDTLRAIRYSRRGHSGSECPPGQGMIADDVADLAALLETVGAAHLVGNSLGAEIALRLAVDRPELVRSLALHEPGFWSLAPDHPAVLAIQARLQPSVERLVAGDLEGGIRLFADKILGPDVALPEPLRQAMLANAATFVDEECAPDNGTLDTTRPPAVPTLLTLGEETDAAFVVVTERLAALIPHADRVTIAGAGHIPHRTHPDLYADIVTGFVTTAHARA